MKSVTWNMKQDIFIVTLLLFLCLSCIVFKMKNCFMRKISIPTLFFFITTVILALTLLLGGKSRGKDFGYDSSTVMSRISHIQELALVKHNYTGVIGFKDYKKILNINIPLTDKYFLLKYNGYLKAGVDFSRIKINTLTDSMVHVSIPRPEIFDTVIDEGSVQIYNESENAFNPIKISDYNEALAREKSIMINDAIKQGILTDATSQAKMVLTAMLEEMGFVDIKITEELVIPQIR